MLVPQGSPGRPRRGIGLDIQVLAVSRALKAAGVYKDLANDAVKTHAMAVLADIYAYLRGIAMEGCVQSDSIYTYSRQTGGGDFPAWMIANCPLKFTWP